LLPWSREEEDLLTGLGEKSIAEPDQGDDDRMWGRRTLLLRHGARRRELCVWERRKKRVAAGKSGGVGMQND
jgi:sugar/nucleoside kinase (ribokinase family)